MLRKTYLVALFLVLGLYSTTSSAQLFRLSFTPAIGMNPVVAAGIEAELQNIEDEINDGLPGATTPDRFMEGMANSSVMAGKGIGSDYASNMSVFLIGAGVGVGADLEKNEDADTDLSGVGVQGGVILGTNLSWMDSETILGLRTDKLNMYVNFLSYSTEKKTGDTNAKIDMASYGVHFSYDWVKPRGNVLLGWGGVKIHWGYEYNKTKLEFDSAISEDLSYSPVGGTTYSSSIAGNPFSTIDVATQSIPLEISSSLQILYFVSIYGGLGADYNLGTAVGKGDINIPTTEVTCAGLACSPGAGDVGDIDADANINGKGKVNPFLFRGFAGVQVNLPFIRVFVQADKAFGTELIGATAGVRFAF